MTDHESLAAALVAFQADMPTVHKGRTATVPMKAGGSYSYKYADLVDVAKTGHPILAKHGLSFSCRPQRAQDGSFVLQGVLRHGPSGEEDTGELPLHGRDAQAIGSSITYGRRYLFGCMTGLVTDEDDDGQGAIAQPQDVAAIHRGAPQVPPHVARLQGALELLSPDLANVIRGWWPTSGYPGLFDLSEEQAAVVYGRVQQLLSEGAPTTAPPASGVQAPAPEAVVEHEAAPERSVTPRQLTMLHTVLSDMGVGEREDKLSIVGRVVRRRLESTNDLTKDEAKTVLDLVTKAGSIDALEALLQDRES